MTRRTLAPLVLLAVVIAVVLAGCGGGGSKGVASGSVARVGKTEITRNQFNALMAQAQRSYTSQKRTFPTAGSSAYIALQNQAVQFLVQRTELALKADELGIKIDDKAVDTRLADIKKQYFGGDEKKYQAQLKSQGLTKAQVRDDIRAQIISEELFKKVTADVKVSDADVAAYYAKNKSAYTQAESRDVRHILIQTKSQSAADYATAKAKADRVYKLVVALGPKGDWTKLAKQYSDDPGSKSSGGKLTISRGQTVPEFDKTAFSLKTNEISKPVKTQFGYHIIEALSNVRPKQVQPLPQVRDTIRSQLLQQRRSETMTKWVESLKKEFASKVAYAPGFEPPAAATTATTTG